MTATVQDNIALQSLRELFHNHLMPAPNGSLHPIQAQIGRNQLDATLFRAGTIAQTLKLETEDAICGVIGTTREILEGLRSFFTTVASEQEVPKDLVADLRNQQTRFNSAVNLGNTLTRTIAPALAFPPPARRSSGFGY